MAKLLPKKELSLDVLKEIIKYYRIDTSETSWDPDDFLEWECFSHPSLELHECNSRAKLPGGHTCHHCENVVGRPCPISCDFQNVCLAAFAWRMGIGGENFEEAFKRNLYELSAGSLFDEVIKVFSMEDTSEPMDKAPEVPSEVNVSVDEAFIQQEEQEKEVMNEEVNAVVVEEN
jgi:hypothetical protein